MNIFKKSKVFSVNFLHKMKFAKLRFAKSRDFGDSRKFLPAKVSVSKVVVLSSKPSLYFKQRFQVNIYMSCRPKNILVSK